MRKVLLSLISLFLIYTTCIYTVNAEEESYGARITDYQPASREVSDRFSLARSSTYPSSYTSKVTSVKDQGSDDTCWAFTYLAMAESYLLINDNETDLSELQLSYFSFNSVDDPLGNTANDKSTIISGDDYLSVGGNAYYATMTMSGYVGAVDEELAVYGSSDSLDSSLAYSSNSYVLKNAYFLDDYDEDTIKYYVTNNGSVYINVYYSSSYYNSSTYSYYCNQDKTINHSVLIVGWDDDYSASDFKSTPNENGAWLVKNSWGEDFGDEGYMWISYEDMSLYGAVACEFTSSNDYDYNYHYDGTCGIKYTAIDNNESIAHIYQVNGSEEESLEAVSFAIQSTDVNYTIDIYTDISDLDDPTSGNKATTLNGKTTYSGLYTVDLQDEVTLNRDDYYSIVITLSSNNDTIDVFVDKTYSDDYVSYKNYSEENQAYYSNNGTWIDYYQSGSFRIKGLTNSLSDTQEESILEEETSEALIDLNSIDLDDFICSYNEGVLTLTLSYLGTTLIEDEDYMVSYLISDSSLIVTITGIGSYTGSFTTTIDIDDQEIIDDEEIIETNVLLVDETIEETAIEQSTIEDTGDHTSIIPYIAGVVVCVGVIIYLFKKRT